MFFWNPPTATSSATSSLLRDTSTSCHQIGKKNSLREKKQPDFHGGSPEAAFSLLQQLGAVPPFAAGSPPPVPSFFKAQKTGPN